MPLGGGAGALRPLLGAGVDAADPDIRIAVVGFRSRGQDHIAGFGDLPGVRITALCDVDLKVLREGVEALKQGRFAKKASRSKRARSNPTRTSGNCCKARTWMPFPSPPPTIGTPWPRFGQPRPAKTFMSEKPVSHSIWEGRKMVQAARGYDKIVQTGTQSRSSQGIREAVEWVRQGNLGKMVRAHGLCYQASRQHRANPWFSDHSR